MTAIVNVLPDSAFDIDLATNVSKFIPENLTSPYDKIEIINEIIYEFVRPPQEIPVAAQLQGETEATSQPSAPSAPPPKPETNEEIKKVSSSPGDPRYLTTHEIAYITDKTMSIVSMQIVEEGVEDLFFVKGNASEIGYIRSRTRQYWSRGIRSHIQRGLSGIQVYPEIELLDDYAAILGAKLASSLARPGLPVGQLTSEAIVAQLTQAVLKTFHRAGGASTVSTGLKAFKEMIDLSQVREDEKIILHFKNTLMTADEILGKRSEIVYNTLAQFARDQEINTLPLDGYRPLESSGRGETTQSNTQTTQSNVQSNIPVSSIPSERPKWPWWYLVHEERISKYQDKRLAIYRESVLGSTTYPAVRLYLDINKLYQYRISMERVTEVIEEKGNFLCLSSPIEYGIVDVIADVQDAQSGTAKSLRGSSIDADTNDIDSFEALQAYLSINLIGATETFVLSGIPRMGRLDPVRMSYWALVNNVYQPTEAPYIKLLYIRHINLQITPLKIDDLLVRLRRQGVLEIERTNEYVKVLVVHEDIWQYFGLRQPERSEQSVKLGVSENEVRNAWTADAAFEPLVAIVSKFIDMPYTKDQRLVFQGDPSLETKKKLSHLKPVSLTDKLIIKRLYDQLPEDQQWYNYAVVQVAPLKTKPTDIKIELEHKKVLQSLYKRKDVNPFRTYSNNYWQNYFALGLIAFRNNHIREFYEAILAKGYTDPRHVVLIVDFMASSGRPESFQIKGARAHTTNFYSLIGYQRPLESLISAASTGAVVSTSGTIPAIFYGQKAMIGTGLTGDKFDRNFYKERKREAKELEQKGEFKATRPVVASPPAIDISKLPPSAPLEPEDPLEKLLGIFPNREPTLQVKSYNG